jgi:hypothetical protein
VTSLDDAITAAFGDTPTATDMVDACGLIGIESVFLYGGRTLYYDATTRVLVGARSQTDCPCGPCGFGMWDAGKVPDASCVACTTCGNSTYEKPCAGATDDACKGN